MVSLLWNSRHCVLESGLRFSALTDGREEEHLPLSLHHMARFWCPRVSSLLPELPPQSAGIGSAGHGSWAGGGALQRGDRTLGDLFISVSY